MVRITRQFKKETALKMRRGGYSYLEIQNAIAVPKSTLQYWFKDIKLSKEQVEKLNLRRIQTARANTVRRILKTRQAINEYEKSASDDIQRISTRELWLMGVVLYWRERMFRNSNNDTKRSVGYSSSDPGLIKFFLKWLFDAGGLKKEDIKLDIFLILSADELSATEKQMHRNRTIKYWSDALGIPADDFRHIYIQVAKKVNKPKIYNIEPSGFMRIRVKSSTLLARQITGWIIGVRRQLELD